MTTKTSILFSKSVQIEDWHNNMVNRGITPVLQPQKVKLPKAEKELLTRHLSIEVPEGSYIVTSKSTCFDQGNIITLYGPSVYPQIKTSYRTIPLSTWISDIFRSNAVVAVMSVGTGAYALQDPVCVIRGEEPSKSVPKVKEAFYTTLSQTILRKMLRPEVHKMIIPSEVIKAKDDMPTLSENPALTAEGFFGTVMASVLNEVRRFAEGLVWELKPHQQFNDNELETMR
jgi:hypothetical protein